MDQYEMESALKTMNERFGHDTLIALATSNDNRPFVRTVDAYYENGSFYSITYALSNKINQININNNVAICGEWFTADGTAHNMGWVNDEKNNEIFLKLKNVFSSWILNGDIDENDKNTIILRIDLTHGILFNHGMRYEIDFGNINK